MSRNEAVERTAALWWLVCKLQERLLKALDFFFPPFPKVLDLSWLQLMGEASPERPASRVAQLLLIGLSRQVNWTFADDGRGPSDQSAWGREREGRSQRKPRAVNCCPLVVTEKLTLRSDGLAEDNRCAVLYRLDSCSGHSLQGETERSE